MKRTVLSLLACSMLAISATAQTGDDIIKKHIDAIGGEKAWSKINSIKLIGNMNMQGMEMPTSRTTVHNKGMRMDFSVMGSENYVILTPKEGWMYIPVQGMDKPKPMPENQVKLSQSKLDIRNIVIADKSIITKAEYAGMDTIDKVPCFKVNITEKSGDKQVSYFDATTYYLVRTEVKIKPDGGEEQEVAMTFGNFQRQPEGIVVAMTESSPMGGDFVYKAVEINKPVSDDIFKPAVETKKAGGETESKGGTTK